MLRWQSECRKRRHRVGRMNSELRIAKSKVIYERFSTDRNNTRISTVLPMVKQASIPILKHLLPILHSIHNLWEHASPYLAFTIAQFPSTACETSQASSGAHKNYKQGALPLGYNVDSQSQGIGLLKGGRGCFVRTGDVPSNSGKPFRHVK